MRQAPLHYAVPNVLLLLLTKVTELLEVPYRTAEQSHVILPGDIPVKHRPNALAVAHFPQHPAIRGSHALDRPQGAVGIKGGVHAQAAVQIHILGIYLPNGAQQRQNTFRLNKPPIY